MLESLIRIFGESILPFQDFFLPVGGSLFVLLIVIEIVREAIDITNGKGINLGKKFILIFFIGTILLGYNSLSNNIYKGIVSAGKEIIPRFEDVNDWIDKGYKQGIENHRASIELDRKSGGDLAQLMLSVVLAILSGLGLLFVYITMVLILVFIAGAYASLSLTLVLGPVFIAMFVSPELRGTGVKWSVILLSVLLTVPAYIMIMKIAATLCGSNSSVDISSSGKVASRSMSNSIESIGILMVNPLLTLGLVFSVSKIINSITGSAGNIASKAGSIATSAATTAFAVVSGMKALSGRKNSDKGGDGKKDNSNKNSDKGKGGCKTESGKKGSLPDANPRGNSAKDSKRGNSTKKTNISLPQANSRSNSGK